MHWARTAAIALALAGCRSPADDAGTAKGTGTEKDPVQVVPHEHRDGDVYCVYKVVDKKPDDGQGIGLQQPVCILCPEDDPTCERDNFWIQTRDHRYELIPRDIGHGYCRRCPEGGTTFERFR